MIFKLGMSAEKNWRRLRGFQWVAKVIEGVKFRDDQHSASKEFQMKKMKIALYSALSLVALGILLPEASVAAPCTPGTDCYCDRVKNVSSPIYDPALLMCEDFEAPTLRLNQGLGNGAPYYGPPYDNGGQLIPNDRGRGGYWQKVYGNGVDSALWPQNQPAIPKLGLPCGFALCSGLKIWSVGDLWDANNYGALAAFLTDSQYTAEPNLTAPTGKAGGGRGSFDGAASLFSRVPAGNSAGIFGNKTWTKTQTFGVTGAVAYASNLVTSGLMGSNWKGDEFIQNIDSAGGDGLFLFGNPPFSELFPFYGFTFSNGATQSSCNTKLAAAIKTTGSFRCDPAGNFIYEASTAQYRQSKDWPLGTWGCVRAYFKNIGSTSSSIQLWFTGPSGVEVKLIDISNMDLTTHLAGRAPAGYVGLAWNNYANVNQAGGGTPTTEASGRYQDNYHIRAGAPVSCTQIGYAGSISSPNNLRVN